MFQPAASASREQRLPRNGSETLPSRARPSRAPVRVKALTTAGETVESRRHRTTPDPPHEVEP